ncbi:MAG: hypothetical protein M1812_006064 [Candelaria pacifica]|nr:MAG: hypothetical protein M1812_006064 [Candelaria pacifica]
MKVIHCVVDVTAFLDGINKIEKWVSEGTMTVFVPICTLAELRRLSKGYSQAKAKALQSLRFVDHRAMRKFPAGSIRLQSFGERYWTWPEVEKHILSVYKPSFGLPKGSANGFTREIGNIVSHEEADSSPLSSVDGDKKRLSTGSSATTTSPNGSPNRPDKPIKGEPSKALQVQDWRKHQIGADGRSGRDRRSGVQGQDRALSGTEIVVPQSEHALLNAVVWQLYETRKKNFDDKSLILLTSSTETAKWAQKFGITVRTLNQLDETITAGQDYKDLLIGSEAITTSEVSLVFGSEGDEDFVVFQPRDRIILPPIGSERMSKKPSFSDSDGGVPLYANMEFTSQTPPLVVDEPEQVTTPLTPLNVADERESQTSPFAVDELEQVSTPLNAADERKSQTPPLAVDELELEQALKSWNAAEARNSLTPPVVANKAGQVLKPFNAAEGRKSQTPTSIVEHPAKVSTPPPNVERHAEASTPVISMDSFSRDLPNKPFNKLNGTNGASRVPRASEPKESTFGRLSPPRSPTPKNNINNNTAVGESSTKPPKGPKLTPRPSPRGNAFRREDNRMAADVDFKLNSGAPRSASHGKGKLWQP